MKIACVLITHFPVKVELRRNIKLRNKHILITTRSTEGTKILDFSEQLRNVSAQMKLQEALYRCINVNLIEADETHYYNVFEEIISTLVNRYPIVEKGKLGCAFIEVHEAEERYCGDEGICSTLFNTIPNGFDPKIGLAESKFAAYVAAHSSEPNRATKVTGNSTDFLDKFPIDLLPISNESKDYLKEIGLRLMGQIASLPAGIMQAQFGTEGKMAWELANGIDKRPLIPFKSQDILIKSIVFSTPLISLGGILSALEILLEKSFSDPSLKGKYIRSISMQANLFDHSTWVKKIVFKNPIHNVESAMFAIKGYIQKTTIPSPFEDLSIHISDITHERSSQLSLFRKKAKFDQLTELIPQLEARLRTRSPIYKIMDIEPWSRIPERRQALVEFVP